MPRTKSAKKALRVSLRRRERNLAVKERFRKEIKKFKKTITSGDKKKAQELFKNICSLLDKAAKRNIIHKNTASRKKSRLARLLK
jgi:small subunit ribosomal protein S20